MFKDINLIFLFYSVRYYSHSFLVDVLCKVSIRFKQLATDHSLWEGLVEIGAKKNPRRAEFVVQECLNSRTKIFVMVGMVGSFAEFYPVLTSPRFDRYINPTKRFPNLKLLTIDQGNYKNNIMWVDDSISDAEELEAFRDFWRVAEA